MKTRVQCFWKAKYFILDFANNDFIPIWPLLRWYTVKPNPSYLQNWGRLAKTGKINEKQQQQQKTVTNQAYSRSFNKSPITADLSHENRSYMQSDLYPKGLCPKTGFVLCKFVYCHGVSHKTDYFYYCNIPLSGQFLWCNRKRLLITSLVSIYLDRSAINFLATQYIFSLLITSLGSQGKWSYGIMAVARCAVIW